MDAEQQPCVLLKPCHAAWFPVVSLSVTAVGRLPSARSFFAGYIHMDIYVAKNKKVNRSCGLLARV
jgi:hypothetical protein